MPCATSRMDEDIVPEAGPDVETKKTKKIKKVKKPKQEKSTPEADIAEEPSAPLVNGHASPVEDEVKEEKKKKKSKKRKQEDSNDDVGEGPVVQKKKSKKKDVSEEGAASDPVKKVPDLPELSPEEKEGAFQNFRISPKTIQLLKARKITYLFPIQAKTFNDVYDGHDVIAQARTGTGKTLSFALPLVEKLQDIPRKSGRPPTVMALAPTRELAKQVCEEFEAISPSLTTCCIYGGVAYWPQESAIRKGIDVLVGTPGRVLDYVQKKKLNLTQLKHVILDEVDRMLDMGFTESVEEILSAVYNIKGSAAGQSSDGEKPPPANPQTLLFSATVPAWVLNTARKYMRQNLRKHDLVGTHSAKTAKNVKHLSIRCNYKDRPNLISDVIRVYSGLNGRIMVFCETKVEANELSMNPAMKVDAQVLHGDIQQQQREITLKGFREGKFQCLVTTDVAARGLDVPEVDLVIQCSPPRDVDSYIHRSGRTGRAGRSGICICFYKPQEEHDIKRVEHQAGMKFTMTAPPQPEDIIKANTVEAAKSLEAVPAGIVDYFRQAARDLLVEKSPEDALATALAYMSGATEMKTRSLITAQQGQITYLLKTNYAMYSSQDAFQALGFQLSYDVKSSIREVRICKDRQSAALDVPQEVETQLMEQWQDSPDCTLSRATELPDIVTPAGGRGGGGGGGGRFGGGGGGRRWGGGGGGRDRRGGGGGGGRRGGGGGGGRWGGGGGGRRGGGGGRRR
ncbi:nucleolar RNA helicase 2-like [Patiria miniata]|uniref:RNA helicase n=1 Tax=Patiria miniata TaxID=46514 RepID=A0A914AAV8_PATMI|nr:nucleolar RNA helicase 2-like [Patiria miniata]